MSTSISFVNSNNNSYKYGSIPQSDSSLPNKDNNNVCSSKKGSFLSFKCTSFKCCIGVASIILLSVLFLFVSGIMYINLQDGVSIGLNNSNNIPSNFKQFSSFSKYSGNNHKIKNNVIYDCDTHYKYTDTVEVFYANEDYNYTNEDKERKYERIYFCYTSLVVCEYCFEQAEDDGDCPEPDSDQEDNPTWEIGCYDSCSNVNVSTWAESFEESDGDLYCFYDQEEYESCYSWDSIITKVIKDDKDNDILITQDVMINDIKLGDYVITGINGEYSKVIDRSHFSIYDRSTETTQLIELCFDKSGLSPYDKDNLLYNCIKLTGKHLIYVNGNDLDSLNRADNVKIGDYLYHTGLNQFVEIIKINTGIKDYYRNIITENGNLVINNGFLTSTIPKSEPLNGNYKDFHLNMVMLYNVFYKLFTLNGIYEELWESKWFDHILRLPTKNAIGYWVGYGGQFSDKYPYPITSMIVAQSIGCLLLYLFTKGMISSFQTTKSVSY